MEKNCGTCGFFSRKEGERQPFGGIGWCRREGCKHLVIAAECPNWMSPEEVHILEKGW